METFGGMTITVSMPTKPKPTKLLKEEVWGLWEGAKLLEPGMIIAQGCGISNPDVSRHLPHPQVCPIFLDKLPFKAVTVLCHPSQLDEVIYWLEYVHGAGCVTRQNKTSNGKIAIRSEYKCW